MKILDAIRSRRLFFDGALGTMLQAAGLPAGADPALWNLANPGAVRAVHEAYLRAGCNVVTANTFGVQPCRGDMTDTNLEESVQAAVSIAREAIQNAAGAEDYVFVALDVGPTGRLLEPLGDLAFEDAVQAYKKIARAGAGADFIFIETMSDLYECKAAILGCREGCELPIFVTVTFDERGRLLSGGDVDCAVAVLEGLGVAALGVNCGVGPEQLEAVMGRMCRLASVPVIANPNAGLPCVRDGKTLFPLEPAGFAAAMEKLVRMGVQHLGGCCGTTPDHMAAMIAACRDLPLPPVTEKTETLVSSGTRCQQIGPVPVLIGERLNPTGKPRMKAALREKDMDFLVREGFAQMDAGAHILDVNVGLPGIDEAVMLETAVRELQSVIPLPLQLDTADPGALERALRCYNGKPLINSVNGKRAVMDAVFPLVKRYGGVVIGLTLDDTGIPDSAQGRLAIARRLVEEAASYGIPKKNIIIDPLAMAVSAAPESAGIALETIRLVRRELGVGASLGVSNISFGLPRREQLNAAFFTMALEAGLSAGIVNPGSEALTQSYHSFLALKGLDSGFASYIARYAAQTPVPAAPVPGEAAPDLKTCVLKGLREPAAAQTRALLAGRTPMEIMDTLLIPALDEVGRDYEAGRSFLPQLLMSAEAARAAFEVLREHIAERGEERPNRGKVALATVYGDIHDIGKNIVAALLSNYGFQVLDLGKNVPVQRVVDCVVSENVRLVGLSALMTTTVGSMAETIAALRAAAPDCRVMVGGAVLTEDYAREIGADYYGRDAMAAVRIAQGLLGGGS